MIITSKARKRILSFGLALAVLLGMTLGLPGPVTAQAALPGPDNPGQPYDGIDFANLTDSGFYYGSYNHLQIAPHQAGSVPIEAGNYINLGYEGQLAPMLWRVVGEDNNSGELTLWSEYVVDMQPFDENGSAIWEDASLRSWLHDDFADSFHSGELEGIANDVVVRTSGIDPAHDSVVSGQRFYIPSGLDFPQAILLTANDQHIPPTFIKVNALLRPYIKRGISL